MKYNLDSNGCKRLEELLQKEMDSVLPKINEDEDMNEDEDSSFESCHDSDISEHVDTNKNAIKE